MYAFLMGNQNIYIDRTTKFLSGPRLEKLEEIDIEIKKKLAKLKEYTDEDIYLSDDDENDFSNKQSSKRKSINLVKSDNIINTNSKTINFNTETKSHLHTNTEKISLTQLKMKEFKNIMKYLDVFVFLLLIIGYILAQMENEDFYYGNKEDRHIKSFMINYLVRNATTYENNHSLIPDRTRGLNFSSFNLTASNFSNLTNASSVYLDLKISDYCNNLRFALLILTALAIPMIIISRYIEFLRNYIYREKLDINFWSTNLFFICIIEILMAIILPYPYLNTFFILNDLDYAFVMPISSILSSFSFIRFYFMLKLIKHLTKWTSFKAETVCEKYVCKADSTFAFKAFQKENPFLLLFIIFIFTCLCFGLSLRIFELYYWETIDPNEEGFQNWNYMWNAMWCIFVSMTTVGYGDFYPKTLLGRIVTIVACLIGIYFVSMMMVFMTEKSILTENEYKAFKLITRLEQRKMIRSIQSKIIYKSLLMAKYKKQHENDQIGEEEFQKKYNLEKRNIISEIEETKTKLRIIKSYDIVPTKEQLFDISERIENDFTEISNELKALKVIDETVINFTDVQLEALKYLKKNCYATKQLYLIMEKNQNFGKLFKPEKKLKKLFPEKSLGTSDLNLSKDILQSNPQQFQSIMFNNSNKKEPQEYDQNINSISDNFIDHNFTQEQILDNFDFVLAKKTRQISNQTKTQIDGKNINMNVRFYPPKLSLSSFKKNSKPDIKID